MMRKTKVAICTDGIYPHAVGGMQKHSRHLIEELSKFDDLEIIVIHPHSLNVFNDSRIQEYSIPAINEKNNYLVECYAYSKRVHKLLQEARPDIVFSQGLSVWYRADDFKDKLIIHPHGLEPFQGLTLIDRIKGYPFRAIFRYLFKRATVVISLGGKLTGIIRNVSRRINVAEIPNAATPPHEVGKPGFSDRVRVLFLGRFAHNKGIDILFASIEELNKQNIINNFEFLIGGKGPLFELYNSRNNYSNVKLPGYVDENDIPRLYQSSDLFILPTLFEGMPTVVLEAMSYGLPIIVSDVGATTVLVNEENGKVVAPGSVKELVAALKWFNALCKEEREKLSDKSLKKFAQEFTWPIVAQQYYQLLRSVA